MTIHNIQCNPTEIPNATLQRYNHVYLQQTNTDAKGIEDLQSRLGFNWE